MCMVEDQKGKLHSMTKVQPVPSTSQDTKTVRMERGTLAFRKARSDDACRDFIRDEVVPLMRRQPERMMNTRVLYPELVWTLAVETPRRSSLTRSCSSNSSVAASPSRPSASSIRSGRICSRLGYTPRTRAS